MNLLRKIPRQVRGYIAKGLACLAVGCYLGRGLSSTRIIEDYPTKVSEGDFDNQNKEQGLDIGVEMRYGREHVFLRQEEGSLRGLVDIESEKMDEIRKESENIRRKTVLSD